MWLRRARAVSVRAGTLVRGVVVGHTGHGALVALDAPGGGAPSASGRTATRDAPRRGRVGQQHSAHSAQQGPPGVVAVLPITHVSKAQLKGGMAEVEARLGVGTRVVAAVVAVVAPSGGVGVGLCTRSLERFPGQVTSDWRGFSAHAQALWEQQQQEQRQQQRERGRERQGLGPQQQLQQQQDQVEAQSQQQSRRARGRSDNGGAGCSTNHGHPLQPPPPLLTLPGAPPRWDQVGSAAAALADIHAPGLMAGLGGEGARAVVAQLQRAVRALSAACEDALDGDVPWAPCPPAPEVLAVGVGVTDNPPSSTPPPPSVEIGAACEAAGFGVGSVAAGAVLAAGDSWRRAAPGQRGVLATVLGLRVRVRVRALAAAQVRVEVARGVGDKGGGGGGGGGGMGCGDAIIPCSGMEMVSGS